MGWFEDRFAPSGTKICISCEECSKPFWLPPSKASRYKRCSPECIKLGSRRRKESRIHSCKQCGSEFEARLKNKTEGYTSFCSIKCSTDSTIHLRNSDEAREKKRAAMLNHVAQGTHKVLRGADNPQWKGGYKASLARRRESKADSIRSKAYRQKNPDKVKEWQKKRNQFTLAKLPRGTVDKIGSLQKWRCAICKIQLKKSYHIDHIMPLALDGEHAPSNLQVLCKTCNLRKNAKHPADYMREVGFLI